MLTHLTDLTLETALHSFVATRESELCALRSPCGTPLHVLLNPTFLAFDLNDGKCAPIVNEWRRRAQHEPQPSDRCQVRRFPSRRKCSTILGSFLRLVLCSASEARVVMELFSEVRMGSLLSRPRFRFHGGIGRSHWKFAQSQKALPPPCLRASGGQDDQAFLVLPTAPPMLFCFLLPTREFRLVPLPSSTSLDIFPRPETAAPNPPNWLAVTSSLVLFTHPLGPQNL